ncbi:glycosyltransferase family 87 protein [Actibacterium ureilyticum]|uniref:glycosyltransferase family 87 protein n=1 Tax=Actibacterium ureilyticum TaxID=1590614 RepID=UPI001140C428|nr:glycosyltransferase family 87 protein [Actibacterium ureilyticum]
MITLRPITLLLLCVAAAVLAGDIAFELARPVQAGKSVLIDFDAFYLVGQMIGEGQLQGAYDPAVFDARQQALVGYGEPLIWSYPPPFNLVVAPFAQAPNWLSYLLFMGGTLAAYLWILRAIAGPQFHATLVLCLALFPIVIRSGQNSFLTGGLIGLACLLALRRSVWAGVPLGLMVIKPHLALGVGLWSVLDRRWGMVAVAFAVSLLACGVATLAYGPAAWGWFIDAAAATQDFLRAGQYPLFRMTSVFAFGLSAGLGPTLAMVLHLCSAAAAIALLIAVQVSGAGLRRRIGAAVFVSALISPYNYDYDLAMLAFSLALLMPAIAARNTRLERGAILIGMWVVGFYGVAVSLGMDRGVLGTDWRGISICGPVLVLTGLVILRGALRARS